MKRLLVLLALVASPAFADKERHLYDWKITRVIDGDTVEIEAPYLPKPLKPTLSIRVLGVDTPEKSWRAECESEAARGEAASKFTTDLLDNATVVKVELVKWDKFGGRVLGDIIIDGASLTELLIANGFARPYDGGKKESWCE